MWSATHAQDESRGRIRAVHGYFRIPVVRFPAPCGLAQGVIPRGGREIPIVAVKEGHLAVI